MADVVMAPGWERALAKDSHAARLRAIKHAERTAQRVCPIGGSGRLRDSILGEAETDTMRCRLSAGDRAMPKPGERRPPGGPVDYATFVELGTGPRLIVSTGPWPLRDKDGRVFGRSVHHPGTPAQPYLRPGAMSIGGYQG